MSRKRSGKRARPKKFCEPAVCDCCLYVGEGDFLCDEHMEIVVFNWEPTDCYLMCQTQRKVMGDDR